jgi:WD40 repeat protein
MKKIILFFWMIAAVTSLAAQQRIKNVSGKEKVKSVETAMKRITSGIHDDMVPYFTGNSFQSDDKYMIFIRTVNDCNNIWVLNLETSEEKQVTYFTDTNPNALCIHEFRQHDYSALNIASVVLHGKTGKVYFIKDRKLWRFDLNGNGRVLTKLPSKVDISNCHINEAGTKFLLSTVDDRAFDLLDANVSNNRLIDEYIQQRNLSSHLMIYDTDTGELLMSEKVHSAWVTHAKFSPVDDNIILYNHEWASFDQGLRRIWIFDGRRHIRLRTEGEGRTRNDGVLDEMWEQGTGNIIYHGSYPNGVHFIGRIAFKNPRIPSDYTITEIPLPPECKKYGHFTVSNDNLLVSDGYYMAPGDKESGSGEWITLFKPDWEKKTVEVKPLCRHRSSWKNQEAHPHPVFNHAANAVFFTSDFEGHRAVYKVNIKP